MLEEEVYGANSPIWDVEFTQNAASASNGAGEFYVGSSINLHFVVSDFALYCSGNAHHLAGGVAY